MVKNYINLNNGLENRYQFIPRTLVFIQHDQKILFIEKKNHNSFVEGKLNGVGGHFEKGEEPYEAAIREINEETGLVLKDLQLAAMIYIDTNKNPGILVFVFKAFSEDSSVIESREGKLLFLSREEIIKEKRIMKDIPFLLEVCDNHRKKDPPKYIKYHYSDSGELRIDIIN